MQEEINPRVFYLQSVFFKVNCHLRNTVCGIRHTEKGAALLLTFMVMVTLISVVGTYLGLVHTSTKSTGARIVDSQAFYIADAGIHYGIDRLQEDPAWTGTSADQSLGAGTFAVAVSALGGNDYRISSTGTVARLSRSVQQDVTITVAWASAFNYAIYGNDVDDTLEIKDQVTINGHLYYDYANGSVQVEEDAAVSTPYYVYANSVSGDGTYTQAPSAPESLPTFPTFTTTTYDNAITAAEARAAGNWELSGSDTYNLNGATLYYNGKVTIKDDATITGGGTIVATDDIKAENNANISSDVTLISKKKIEIKNDAVVQSGAVLYGRTEVKLKDNANVTGSLIVATSGKKVKMEDDSTLTGIIYAAQAELKDDITINGAVVADSYKGDKIKDNVIVNYNSSYFPSSIPTGLETGGVSDIEAVANTWREI